MSDTNAQPNALSPRAQLELACGVAFDEWKQTHEITAPLDGERAQLVGRAAVWLGPGSVLAGLTDIMASARRVGGSVDPALQADLVDRIVRTIKDNGGFSLAAAHPPVKRMAM